MNNKILSCILVVCACVFVSSKTFAQETSEGQFHGNFELNLQQYNEDSLIHAPAVDEKVRTNAYANFTYTKGKFNFGARYEMYLNPLLGYDSRYAGHGIGYRYASYMSEEIEITAGHFYEQFGNGLIFRTYEDKNLGYDNALDGARVKYRPAKGLTFTGVIGKQKLFFDYGNGIVRGVDADWDFNTLVKKLSDKALKLQLGGSFVSKFQEANDPVFNYPENVAAGAGRIRLTYKNFSLNSEYVYKSNDPSGGNLYDFEPNDGKNLQNPVFRDGQALYANAAWSVKGFGVVLSGMSLDNMNFRSERFATGNDLHINYLPALSKNHTYALAAMYPFSTQSNGQMAFNSELFFKIPKTLKGIGGMHFSLNFSQVMALKKTDIQIDPELNGYEADIFTPSDELYYQDFNIEVTHKLTKAVKATVVYIHQTYNIEQIQGKSGEDNVVSDIAILDMTVKLNKKHALRLETQHLASKQFYGSWASGMLEYTFAPHWFVSVADQFNYDNPKTEHKTHYYNTYAGFVRGGNRIQIGYGRQREGVICVGGVCRNTPASNGFSVVLSSTF